MIVMQRALDSLTAQHDLLALQPRLLNFDVT